MTTVSALDIEEFRLVMRRTASAVGVLATDGPAGRVGITVSSLSSLSFEPASVICCVHRQSRALAILLENGVFTANFLSAGQSIWRMFSPDWCLNIARKDSTWGPGSRSQPVRLP